MTLKLLVLVIAVMIAVMPFANADKSEKKEFIGVLEVLHIDNFARSTSEEVYSLIDSNGKEIKLKFSNSPELKSGDRVKLKGSFKGEYLYVDTRDSTSVNLLESANYGNTGEKKLLVVLANFADTSQPSLNRGYVNSLLNDMGDYYSESSYSQVTVISTLEGWEQLSQQKTCDLNTVTQYVITELDNTVNFQEYSNIVTIAPFENCGFGGTAYIGARGYGTNDGMAILGVSAINSDNFALNIISHELGHNFGNMHAGFLDCNVNCNEIEYGDIYDVMGHDTNGHFNAMHKDKMGWLNDRIIDVQEDGEYTINNFESNSIGVKALKIIRGENDYLYVEYRQPIGFDSGLGNIGGATNVFEGALFHISNAGNSDSLLIDANGFSDVRNSVLLLNEEFTDSNSGTKVRVTAKDNEHITLAIDLGKTDFTNPYVYITSPGYDQTVKNTININVDSYDNVGINKVEYYVNNYLMGSSNLQPFTLNWDTTKTLNGYFELKAKAIDFDGNYAYSSINVYVNNSVSIPSTGDRKRR